MRFGRPSAPLAFGLAALVVLAGFGGGWWWRERQETLGRAVAGEHRHGNGH